MRIGLVVIGSLEWDQSQDRKDFRTRYFRPMVTPVRCPIYYGRQSISRNLMYTMCLSNSVLNGIALLRDIKIHLQSKRNLNLFMIDLAETEGFKNGLNSSWGTIGLLNHKGLKPEFRNHWLEFYKDNSNGFDHTKYIVNNTQTIDSNAMIDCSQWIGNFNDYDMVFVAMTVPTHNYIPEIETIAKSMIQRHQVNYFDMNITHGITTYQDHKINNYISKNI